MDIPVNLVLDEAALESLTDALAERLRRREQGDASAASVPTEPEVRLPVEWRQLDQRSGVTYTWGEDRDEYKPFTEYEGEISGVKQRLAIGKCERSRTYGQERIYYIVIAIGPEGGLRAVAEFLATDDYEDSHEVIAIIKGKEGTGRQFDRADELPAIYRDWNTVTYRDRVDYPGSFLKQGLVCRESDHTAMLNHSIAQMQLRRLG